MSRSRGKSGGFIISLELILIFTILILGTLGGFLAVKRALINLFLRNSIIVVDSSDPIKRIGKAFDFDQFEAPRILFTDYDSDPAGTNRRALVGVRDDRFTTRHQIYYPKASGADPIDCTVTAAGAENPCIIQAGDETLEEASITTPFGPAGTEGFIGYLYPMQPDPATPTDPSSGLSYGVGRTDPASPLVGTEPQRGTLYRQTADQCSFASPDENGFIFVDVWTSQKVVAGEPCDRTSACLGFVRCTANCDLANPENVIGQLCVENTGGNGRLVCGGSPPGCSTSTCETFDTDCDGFIDVQAACTDQPPGTTSCCPLVNGEKWARPVDENGDPAGNPQECCPPGTIATATGCRRSSLGAGLGILREAEPTVLLEPFIPNFRILPPPDPFVPPDFQRSPGIPEFVPSNTPPPP
jgi:hypothetical protein